MRLGVVTASAQDSDTSNLTMSNLSIVVPKVSLPTKDTMMSQPPFKQGGIHISQNLIKCDIKTALRKYIFVYQLSIK